MDGYKKIGEKIRFYREKKNLSIEDIAKNLSMTVSRFEDIESGNIKYQFSTLLKIANILEVDLPELLNF